MTGQGTGLTISHKRATILLSFACLLGAASCKHGETASSEKGVQSKAAVNPVILDGSDFSIELSEDLEKVLKSYTKKVPQWDWWAANSSFGVIAMEPEQQAVIELYARGGNSNRSSLSGQKPFSALKVGFKDVKDGLQVFSGQRRTSFHAGEMLLEKIDQSDARDSGRAVKTLYPLMDESLEGKVVGHMLYETFGVNRRGEKIRPLATLQSLCSAASEDCDICISEKGHVYKIVNKGGQCPDFPANEDIPIRTSASTNSSAPSGNTASTPRSVKVAGCSDKAAGCSPDSDGSGVCSLTVTGRVYTSSAEGNLCGKSSELRDQICAANRSFSGGTATCR
jgi:hypothetical protein